MKLLNTIRTNMMYEKYNNNKTQVEKKQTFNVCSTHSVLFPGSWHFAQQHSNGVGVWSHISYIIKLEYRLAKIKIYLGIMEQKWFQSTSDWPVHPKIKTIGVWSITDPYFLA